MPKPSNVIDPLKKTREDEGSIGQEDDVHRAMKDGRGHHAVPPVQFASHVNTTLAVTMLKSQPAASSTFICDIPRATETAERDTRPTQR